MVADINGLRAIAAKRDRYRGQLDRLRKTGKQTSCVEAAVSSACDTLQSGTTSFVMRCSKFTLVWMDYTIKDLANIRTESVGTERGDKQAAKQDDIRKIIADLKLAPKLGARQEAVLAHYVDDMRSAVTEAARVLSSDGRAIYVVGENTISGTFIPNAKIVSAVAELCGLGTDSRRARQLPANRRYLPPPTKRNAPDALGGRMRREVILSFSKYS